MSGAETYGRLLHREPDGSLTWRLRGETVPATRATDVRLNIDPAAEAPPDRLAPHRGTRPPATCPARWSAAIAGACSARWLACSSPPCW